MPVIGEYTSRISPPQDRETVPANVGLAAAPAQAVAGIGGALTDFGASVLGQISQAEDAMELATLRGRGGEIRNAAFDTITTTQDPEIREQIFNKAWQDYNALTTKRPNVQRVFDAEKKTDFVNWQADFNTVNNRLRVQNVKYQFRLNYDQLLEQGNLTGALQLLNTAKGTMAITPAEFDFYKSTMESDSVIAQSRILIGNNNPQAAIEMLEGLKGLSGEQLDRRDSLIVMAQQSQFGINKQIEAQREKDRDEITKLIRLGKSASDRIENSNLDEKEQWTWFERERAETERLIKGKEIITDNGIRTELYNDIMGILTGTKTKKEVLDKAKAARFDPKNPTLDESDYSKIETAIHAQYEQAYGQGMSKVNRNAEGILLNPDSLGYIKNAPIRYKILGDFNEAWLKWIASKGDTLKISEIYPEGRRMVANFQISDNEAERQEVEMNKRLAEKEATVSPKMPTDKKILEAAKKVGGEQTETKAELPQPKTKEEYDKLNSGTKYIDPDGVERTKK